MTSEGPPQAKIPRHDHDREDMEVDTNEDMVPGYIDASQIMLWPSTMWGNHVTMQGLDVEKQNIFPVLQDMFERVSTRS